jgi:hypothetical protein
LEDLQDMKRKDFKPQDVYKIARYLKVRVDEIPAIVFFTEPNKRRDLYILNLSDIIYESEEYDEESINFIFSKMAAIIDDICEIDQGRTDRMEVLQAKFNREFKRINGDVENYGKVLELLRKTSITAKNVFSAIGEAVQTYNSILGIMA